MPTLAALMDDAEAGVLAYMTFPAARASGQRLVLGQQACEAKSNETTAISCSEYSLTTFERFTAAPPTLDFTSRLATFGHYARGLVVGYP